MGSLPVIVRPSRDTDDDVVTPSGATVDETPMSDIVNRPATAVSLDPIDDSFDPLPANHVCSTAWQCQLSPGQHDLCAYVASSVDPYWHCRYTTSHPMLLMTFATRAHPCAGSSSAVCAPAARIAIRIEAAPLVHAALRTLPPVTFDMDWQADLPKRAPLLPTHSP